MKLPELSPWCVFWGVPPFLAREDGLLRGPELPQRHQRRLQEQLGQFLRLPPPKQSPAEAVDPKHGQGHGDPLQVPLPVLGALRGELLRGRPRENPQETAPAEGSCSQQIHPGLGWHLARGHPPGCWRRDEQQNPKKDPEFGALWGNWGAGEWE